MIVVLAGERPDARYLVAMIGTAILFLFSLVGVQAQPRGVVFSPVDDCSALPKFNNVTNIAGPWTITVDGCTVIKESGGSCSIEGFAASCDVKRSADEKGIQKGAVSIRVSSERYLAWMRLLRHASDHHLQYQYPGKCLYRVALQRSPAGFRSVRSLWRRCIGLARDRYR